jgi:AraC family transcriptional regulator
LLSQDCCKNKQLRRNFCREQSKAMRDGRMPFPTIRVSPPEIARVIRIDNWLGVTAESFEPGQLAPYSYRVTPQHHVVVVHECGTRVDGETVIEGFARSTRKSFARTVHIVPAGATIHGWTVPSTSSRNIHLYFDPTWPLVRRAIRSHSPQIAPQLHAELPSITKSACRLKSLIGSRDAIERLWAEGLGIVLACEILRLSNVSTPLGYVKGGLSAAQVRRIKEYIEANIAGDLSLAVCARMVSLSTFHFAHAFKQSFGMPPHSYVTQRRIELAKERLAAGRESITEIAVELGFRDAGSFTKRFRNVTGATPSKFREESH